MRLGSLFSGYGGLDLAIKAVIPSIETVFVADICKVNKDGSVGHHDPCRAPCSILAHRFPDAPNLGDVSLIDWASWRGQIDILAAGFPCQDVSVAGGRAGLRDGTRTGLWSQVVRAIRELNPRLVVLENVPGIFTAPAAGDVEPCPWCLGERPDEHLRALDAVLADLATLGLDAEWVTLPASGVGAPHRRERWFCAAYPKGQPWRIELGDGGATANPGGGQLTGTAVERNGLPIAGECAGGAASVLMPTPRATDGTKGGPNQRGSSGDLMLPSAVALLPTPAVNDMGAGKTVEAWDEWTDAMKAKHGNGNGNGHGKSLHIEVQRLLPTPTTQDGANNGGPSQFDRNTRPLNTEVLLLPTPMVGSSSPAAHGQISGDYRAKMAEAFANWGEYGPAIRRWEALTRTAPDPTKPGKNGNPKLSDEFDEWLMGLPAGWITDVPGVTWNETLKACGNGVVWQQGATALGHLLDRIEALS